MTAPSPESGSGLSPAAPAASAAASAPPESRLQGLRQLIDRLLVADVFLVLAGALWFGLAVVLHSQGIEAPLQAFQSLWEPLFTPAIGLLMAAALLSGALGWWQRRGQR